jgi:HSP20 family protein
LRRCRKKNPLFCSFLKHIEINKKNSQDRVGTEVEKSSGEFGTKPVSPGGKPKKHLKEEKTMTFNDLFREMETMGREMDDLFRGFGPGRAFEPSFATALGGRRYPRVNLREDADSFYVEALLPGVDPKTLEATVLGNSLTIAGERQNGVGENVTWHRRERGTGRFLRTIDIPAEVDAERVQADYRDGVLRVTLPKAPSARPRRIEIKAN